MIYKFICIYVDMDDQAIFLDNKCNYMIIGGIDRLIIAGFEKPMR